MSRELPLWVVNEKKYDRAVLDLKKTLQPVTDESIKALYVKYGGLVLTEEEIVAKKEEEEVVEVRPRGRRAR